ncbi:MAG: FIG024746: hypothetical protein [uncultured Thiotrichaceae bacterium]|uniref:Low-complexity protein n=1 Tax=uncultured Thiotrichaceae bacterium TaxID=298394 RepID=A0A6S6UCL9_9GAMM|nr:MAG: FIG024746: hypothetical protein [uncultured Thiotrichaceae bacterium]
MITRKNLLAVAVSTSLAATMVACSGTSEVAKDGASAKTEASAKAMEGKCGEGKCGGDKAKKEGKCGEGKCGSK